MLNEAIPRDFCILICQRPSSILLVWKTRQVTKRSARYEMITAKLNKPNTNILWKTNCVEGTDLGRLIWSSELIPTGMVKCSVVYINWKWTGWTKSFYEEDHRLCLSTAYTLAFSFWNGNSLRTWVTRTQSLALKKPRNSRLATFLILKFKEESCFKIPI